MIARRDNPDSPLPKLAKEPMDAALANEPTDPMERIEPTDPMERIDPVEPMDNNESREPMLHFPNWVRGVVMRAVCPNPEVSELA